MDNKKLHGVNLGGWLILEKWMTPELFKNTSAEDEFGLIQELGSEDALKHLDPHWQTFITKNDLIWIKNKNLNTVRIPVGYWNFIDDEYFISSKKYFDQVIEWCEELDLKAIIDLHAAPGSQNGKDHSGRIGEINWHISPENIKLTLEALKVIAEQFGQKKCVVGIELLNEPHWDVPLKTLMAFYKKGYEIIRQYSETAVIMHDGFRPNAWEKFIKQNNFKNVMLDMHLYQCFYDGDKSLNVEEHLYKTRTEWKNVINEIQTYIPVIIGEWSREMSNESLIGLTEEEKVEANKLYFQTQIEVFEDAAGWFFWNYKLGEFSSYAYKSADGKIRSNWSYKDIMGENS